jgi:hypothetical protein
VPYAIDFTNPAPDMHRESILAKHFDWCVAKMTDLVVKAAKGEMRRAHGYAFGKHVKTPHAGHAHADGHTRVSS